MLRKIVAKLSPYRDMSVFYREKNNGNLHVLTAAVAPEVQYALTQWIKSIKNLDSRGVLIGGLAYSFWVKPRYTQDVDLLFLKAGDVPDDVDGFKRIRPHTLQDKKNHVEIETVIPSLINLPTNVARKVIDTALDKNGIKVASVEGLIALKLHAARMRDKGDIVELLKQHDTSMKDWQNVLTLSQLDLFQELKQIAATER